MTEAAARVSSPKRGVNGTLMRAFRARDLRIRVTAREEVSKHFVRLQFDDGGLLDADDVYPTYWLRLWFTTTAGKGHQRAYTVVQPDHENKQFWLEFYLHPGIASDWAGAARVGDEIDASILNGRSPLVPDPTHIMAVGDGASVPAIADLLLRMPPAVTADVLLERGYDDDHEVLPMPNREGTDVTWFDRDDTIADAALDLARIRLAGEKGSATNFFVALEGHHTRRISRTLRKEFEVPKERVNAQAYWTRGKTRLP